MQRRALRSFFLSAVTAAWAPLANAEDVSYFGVTGLLGVPTASTPEAGAAVVGVNRHNPNPERLGGTENYFFSLGFWPGLEVAGRLVEGLDPPNEGIRDLSLDLKYQFLSIDGGPRLAIGLQDFGGQAPFFRSKYAVATWPWRSLSASVGYGTGPDVLEGVFGGLEWSPSPYLSVLADHDASDTHAGLRLSTGSWLGRLRAALTASYNDATEEVEAGLTLHFPLGINDSGAPGPVTETEPAIEAPSTKAEPLIADRPASDMAAARDPAAALQELESLPKALARQGFESVRVGRRPNGTVVVVIDNRVYNHSFLDAMGVALATVATRMDPSIERVELTLARYSVPQLTVTVPLASYRQFLAGAGPDVLRGHWQIRYADSIAGPDEIVWLDTAAPLYAVELILDPVLRTFVGTEYGALDYGLALRASTVLPLARGFLLNAGVQVPVALSDDFRDGENFEGSAPEPGLDHLLFQFFHKPTPQWAWLWSAGVTQVARADLGVVALEQLWLSDSGAHQWRGKFMAFDAATTTRVVALGGYTWFDAPRRYSLSLTGGRFYTGEGGVKVEVNRYFGDTIFGFFWRAASRDDQVAGFQVSVPLTPRRDQQPESLQIKGSPRWSYGLGTTVNDSEGRNPLRPSLLFEPALDLDLRRDFFDAGRLTPEQLEFNTPRLLDASTLVQEQG